MPRKSSKKGAVEPNVDEVTDESADADEALDPTESADEALDRDRSADEASDDDDDALEAEIVEDAVGESDDDPDGDMRIPPLRLRGTSSLATRSDSLARYDPLEAYMRDVNRYEVLDADTQRDMAIHYQDTGDVAAAARLVTTNLRLVVKIAYEYRKAHRNLMDLIQEGNIGLMQAVKKYDPYKGVKLSSYAAWWIRAYILRFVLNNSRLVKLGTTQAQRKLFFNLNKEKAKLSAMGIDPTPETIAARLNVKAEEVTSMDHRLSGGEVSLDAPVSAADGRSMSRVELLPGAGQDADDWLADEQIGQVLSGHLRDFGATLKDKERRIFYDRLLADDPLTLQQLGDDFGVSRERVRQLEKRLQGKLREYLEAQVGSEAFSP